jgi:Ca2+-binding EF-hand superfamily protein
MGKASTGGGVGALPSLTEIASRTRIHVHRDAIALSIAVRETNDAAGPNEAMTRLRPPKKTESLEVRLPHDAKRAFMSKARDEGRTASDVLRAFVDSYAVASEAAGARKRLRRSLKLASMAAIAATGVAFYALTPTAVAAAPELEAMFVALDGNQDGALSREEFVDRRGAGVVLLRTDNHLTASRQTDLRFTVPFDTDRPTRLSQDDLAEMLDDAFAEQDGDRNGVVTFGEWETHHLAMFRQAFDQTDLDKDGGIEPPEYDKALRRRPRWLPEAPRPFASADKNGDGRITWNEYRG